jgi:trimeric autotransporter adhesin
MLSTAAAFAQVKVGDNPNTILPTSALEIESTNKGVLIPRMTKAQKNAIATPSTGLLIFQSAPDSVGFHYYNGTVWLWLNPNNTGNDWKTTGNVGTDTAVNFIGTTDNIPLRFKQNNGWMGQWDRSKGNYAIGNLAEKSIIAGRDNIAIGDSSLLTNTFGNNNIAIGQEALFANVVGNQNIGIGLRSLVSNTSGLNNTGIGFFSLRFNTSGGSNSGYGPFSLDANTTGNYNTGVGVSAGYGNTTGSGNSFVGYESGNVIGNANVAVGMNALGKVGLPAETVNSTIAIGDSALFNIKTGATDNTAIGSKALNQNTTGSKNIAIGNSTLVNNTTGFQNIALGRSALEKNSNGFANIAIGDSVLSANTTADWNIGIGRSTLQETTTGDKNIAIGDNAMANNITGQNNVAIGYASQVAASTNNRNNTSLGFRSAGSMQGYSNTIIGGDAMGKPAVSYTVNNTVAVGDSVLFNITTGANSNTAIGSKVLYSNTSGKSNTALGVRALYGNITGSNNVAIGDSAAYNSNVSDIVAIGSKALFANTSGTLNTAIGSLSLKENTSGLANTSIGYASLASNLNGGVNTAQGYFSLGLNVSGSSNTAIGSESLSNNTIGNANTALGRRALSFNTTGNFNTAVGFDAMRLAIGKNNSALGASALANIFNGNYNVAIGDSTAFNSEDSYNVAIGSKALFTNIHGENNTAIGTEAGYNTTGSGNIFLGYEAGRSSTTSNQLYIDNSSTASPLIFGDFATNLLRVNGTLNINNQYSLPTVDGATNQVLYTNGAGTVGWANAVGAANNGLNVLSSVVKLGGTLTDSTTITQGSRSMVFDLNGTGDFYVRKNTTDDAFMVKNNGFVGLNTSDPQYRLHIVNVSGGNGPFGRGLVIENSNTSAIGEASIAFKNNGPGSVPTNRAWMSGLNNATNYVFAYGDSLKAGNVKMKLDTTGNVSIGINGLGAQSRFDVFGSIGNSIKLIGANYTANDDDHTIIVSAGTGAITIVLPAASACERREYIIVNRTNTDKTLNPAYNDFSGTSTAALANNSITLQSNGVAWYRIR